MVDSLFARPARDVVRVALPVPIDSLFDYAVPEALEAAALPGCRALVPFSGRRLTGVIIARLEGAELAPEALKKRLDSPARSRIAGRTQGFTVLIPDPSEEARRYRVELTL